MKFLNIKNVSKIALSMMLLNLISTQVKAENCKALPKNNQRYQIVNFSSDKAIDVDKKSRESGANIISYAKNSGTNQQFIFNDLGNGFWTIKASHSDLFLDVSERSQANGGNIIQWAASGQSNQQWRLLQDSTGAFSIRSAFSDKAITVAGSDNGANIYQNDDLNVSSQRWYLNPVNGSCDSANDSNIDVTGFASLPGSDGLATTTGGAGGSSITVTSCSALKSALVSSNTTIIQIPNNTHIDCRTGGSTVAACAIECPEYQDPGEIFYRIPNSGQSCTSLGGTTNTTVNKVRNDISISVKSNKTLIGLGDNAKIIGATLDLSNSKNIIVKNLNIDNINPHLVEGGDGISLNSSSHIVIDHVNFSNISDGYVDIKNSKNITLSHNEFDGYNPFVCGNQHWYTNAVTDSEVTFHHNFWNYTAGRNPKLDGSKTRAHLYNNYWLEITYFAINTTNEAQALIESNYFDDSRRPHWNVSGYMKASNNVYAAQSATDPQRDTGNSVFTDVSMYIYQLDDAYQMPLLNGESGPK
ncbi:RICIN domain-containing protein [Pseudoalteromonas fuliginea]|uniref:pectin lyase n=1 Tax=Pseudoalteromonas fuliginea TaxID=1872678 RepID=A0ABD3Y3Y8_9GAMM|nr:RICIN domain-containing protein [Pseudoalteromonas fuliginea]KDC48139.1 pectate lyase [Pseudoalteromonas fuliginea]KJZ23197.1 pectate lyase [Pseudoalteromonas fuliginea]